MIIVVVFWLSKYIFFWWNSWMSCKESSLRNYGTTKTCQNVVNSALPTLCLVAFLDPAWRLKARLPLSGTESDHPVTSYQRLAPSLIEGSAALCVVVAAAALVSGATISSRDLSRCFWKKSSFWNSSMCRIKTCASSGDVLHLPHASHCQGIKWAVKSSTLVPKELRAGTNIHGYCS